MKVNRIYWKGQAKPWGIEYSLREAEKRRRVRKFFSTEQERDDYALERQAQIQQEGLKVLAVTAGEAASWQRLKAWCAARGQDPVEAVQRFITAAGIVEKSVAMETAVTAFLADKKVQNVNAVYLVRLEHYLKNLADTFKGREVGTITPDDIRRWMTGLGFQTETRINYRKYASAFYEFCLKQGWVGRNPVKLVSRPRLIRPEPLFLSVNDARRLMAANETVDPGICGLLALGLFAGLRASSVIRMTWAEIDLKNKRIVLPGAMMKSGRRHLMEGLPANLWPWLKQMPKEAMEWDTRFYYWRRMEAFRRAGLTPAKNVFRHSFATYFCAIKGEAATAAAILAQRDPRMVWEHYKGAAPKSDGLAFFRIVPKRNPD